MPVPPLLKVVPSAKLAKVPLIGLAEILLIAVKTEPGVNVPVVLSTNSKVRPL